MHAPPLQVGHLQLPGQETSCHLLTTDHHAGRTTNNSQGQVGEKQLNQTRPVLAACALCQHRNQLAGPSAAHVRAPAGAGASASGSAGPVSSTVVTHPDSEPEPQEAARTPNICPVLSQHSTELTCYVQQRVVMPALPFDNLMTGIEEPASDRLSSKEI